jgi:hypothetical protein
MGGFHSCKLRRTTLTADIYKKVGNCVTTLRIKTFLALLYVAPVTFLIAVLPILRQMANHIRLALSVSQADPWTKRVWWNWFGSWVFVGGPFGRWAVGTILGFRILKSNRHEIDEHFPGSIVEQPHLRIIVVAGFGSMLCLFAMVIPTFKLHHRILIFLSGSCRLDYLERLTWTDVFGHI